MKTLRAIPAYLIALSFVLVVPVSFIGLTDFARLLVNVTGLKVSPIYSGGPVAREIPHGAYTTRLHEPVFESLIGRSKEGFVQIDWTPKADVPPVIDEMIDYDADGRPDFRVRWDRARGVPELVECRAGVLARRGTTSWRSGMPSG
jgi:hypothetical protein